jgi:hypothetical protein
MQLAIRKLNNEVMNDRQLDGILHADKIASQFGGVAEDYEIIEVPAGLIPDVKKARFIEYDGENFTIVDTRPLLIIEGLQITITAGWMRGNERLLDDAAIDISLDSENNRELEIEVVRDDVTEDIKVVKYLWLETEDKGDLPTGKSFISSILKMSIPAGTTDLTEVL